MNKPHASIEGCLFGTAVGDALGLPYEGLSSARAIKLLGLPTHYRFCFGKGMISDDTEHTVMMATSMLATWDKLKEAGTDELLEYFATCLKAWILGVPTGVGLATLRACLKLLVGVNPQRSGVFSAGNGPAMRAAIIGACCENYKQIQAIVKSSTSITHTDPKAEYGALAIAFAAWHAKTHNNISFDDYLRHLVQYLPDDPVAKQLISLLQQARSSQLQNQSTSEFATALGCQHGVSGYVFHTVPVAIHAWICYPGDYRSAVTAVIRCGGDTDTTAAIVGGIVGSACGKAGIPAEWLLHLSDWPITHSWMNDLAQQLAAKVQGQKAMSVRMPMIWCFYPRNFLFLCIVLMHGFRRLFPPY
ncbi:MAG: ADP-ribosylglycohydrolase family protein [Pirellulales bacterium]|nr:ADP-ribosylglycohydrolase family protein [Pirellulales bacterium]